MSTFVFVYIVYFVYTNICGKLKSVACKRLKLQLPPPAQVGGLPLFNSKQLT